jgi:hypothetical protein
MEHDANYYDKKWEKVIANMPIGGDYRFDLRKYGYKLIVDTIPRNSKVFDYACGLGVIGQMLDDNGVIVDGCDFSPVAVNYCNKNIALGEFMVTGEIHDKYDVLIASYFLEHIKDPDQWVKMALEHAPRVICSLPRNFRHVGEHIDMGWSNWVHFKEVFKEFDFIRLDTVDENNIDTMDDKDLKYHNGLGQFAHPIIEFRKKGMFQGDNGIDEHGIELKAEKREVKKEKVIKPKKKKIKKMDDYSSKD